MRNLSVFQVPNQSIDRTVLNLKRRDFSSYLILSFRETPDFPSPRELFLGLGEKTLFAFEKKLLSVLFEVTIAICFRARLIDEFPVPRVFAPHAMGIIDDAYEVPLNARATRFVFAVRARDFDP
jgi:hypothetical protein